MSKKKTSTEDFLRLLDEDSDQSPAFSPMSIAKHESKLSQSEAKVESIHESKLSQSEAKLEPIHESKNKTRVKLEPQLEPIHESKLSQSEAKLEPIRSFESLVGLQRNCLFYIFESCLNNGSKVSSSININNMAFAVESTSAAARKAVQRLEEKSFIYRDAYKDGRGGWTKYSIPQSVFSELLSIKTRAKVEPILSQTRAKVDTQLEPQLEPNASSKLVSNNINKLTNSLESNNWLKELNFSPVSPINYMSVNVTIRDMVLNALEPSIVQDFINRYESWLGTQNNVKSHLAMFCDKLKELAKEKDSPVLSCMTKDERQIEVELQEKFEKIKQGNELIQKHKNSELQKTLDLEFKEFLLKNPNYLDEVKAKNTIVTSREIIEKIAFNSWIDQRNF